MIFQGSGCFKFPVAVVTSTAKDAVPKVVHYKFSLFRSRKCRVEITCTTVTNFCSEGKVMLLLSVVCYQVLLCFRHIRYERYIYKQAM